MLNGEAKTPLALRRDGKGKIWSYIRQNWFVEFPEEVVRQEFVCHLVNGYGFSLDQMGEELEVQRGRQSAEADIVIWRTAQDKRDAKPPLIVAECKADNVTISPKDYGHGESYACIVDAPFFAKVREQLLAEAAAACAKFEAGLGKKNLPPAKRAELLRKEYKRLQRDLDPRNTQSRLWKLSNRHSYGTDANDRMARTSKMNTIMHGDGHRRICSVFGRVHSGSASFIEVGLSELELSRSSCRVKSIK